MIIEDIPSVPSYSYEDPDTPNKSEHGPYLGKIMDVAAFYRENPAGLMNALLQEGGPNLLLVGYRDLRNGMSDSIIETAERYARLLKDLPIENRRALISKIEDGVKVIKNNVDRLEESARAEHTDYLEVLDDGLKKWKDLLLPE